MSHTSFGMLRVYLNPFEVNENAILTTDTAACIAVGDTSSVLPNHGCYRSGSCGPH